MSAQPLPSTNPPAAARSQLLTDIEVGFSPSPDPPTPPQTGILPKDYGYFSTSDTSPGPTRSSLAAILNPVNALLLRPPPEAISTTYSTVVGSPTSQPSLPSKGTSHKAKSNKSSEKENVKPRQPKRRFSGKHLIQIARVVLETEPFLACHGNKTAAWDGVLKKLKVEGFDCDVKAEIIRQKAGAMVKYNKNPDSQNDHIRAISRVLKANRTDEITIAGLLDRMEAQFDKARKVADDKKQLAEKHNEEGEAIHSAVMKNLKPNLKRQYIEDNSADCDNVPLLPSSQLSSMPLPIQRPYKARRLTNEAPWSSSSSSSRNGDLMLQLLKQHVETREQEFEMRKQQQAQLESYMQNSQALACELVGVLRSFIDKSNS